MRIYLRKRIALNAHSENILCCKWTINWPHLSSNCFQYRNERCGRIWQHKNASDWRAPQCSLSLSSFLDGEWNVYFFYRSIWRHMSNIVRCTLHNSSAEWIHKYVDADELPHYKNSFAKNYNIIYQRARNLRKWVAHVCGCHRCGRICVTQIPIEMCR